MHKYVISCRKKNVHILIVFVDLVTANEDKLLAFYQVINAFRKHIFVTVVEKNCWIALVSP